MLQLRRATLPVRMHYRWEELCYDKGRIRTRG